MAEIIQSGIRSHSKASEKYVDVTFSYDNGLDFNTSVPIQYRRTGIDIPEDDLNQIRDYLQKVYKEVNPDNWENWKKEQIDFWKTKPKAKTTKSFFDKLTEDFE